MGKTTRAMVISILVLSLIGSTSMLTVFAEGGSEIPALVDTRGNVEKAEDSTEAPTEAPTAVDARNENDPVGTTEATTEEDTGSVFLGDITGDNAITVLDAIALQKFILGHEVKIDVKNADMDGDGQIDIFDLALLKRKLLSTQGDPEEPKGSWEEMVADAEAKGYVVSSVPFGSDGEKCGLIDKPGAAYILYIPDGVKSLNSDAFTDFKNLKSNSQTQLTVIGGNSLETTRQMFDRVELGSLDISGLNTSNVIDMSNMFSHTKIHYGIQGLDSLDTSNVTEMGRMFYDFTGLNLDISNFDTSKVKSMLCMFSHCKVGSVKLDSLDTSKVTTMEEMFASCDINNIDISNLNLTALRSKGCYKMFNCAKFGTLELTDIDMSTDHPYSKDELCKQMFTDCDGGTVKFKNVDFTNRLSFESMFYSSKVDVLNFKDVTANEITSTKKMFQNSQIGGIYLGELSLSNVTDMNSMFDNCETGLLSLTSIKNNKVTDMAYMFNYCSASTIAWGDIDTSNVTKMNCMFQHCKTGNLDLEFNTSKVTTMQNMFRECLAKTIVIKSFTSESLENTTDMFTDCETSDVRITDEKILAEYNKSKG